MFIEKLKTDQIEKFIKKQGVFATEVQLGKDGLYVEVDYLKFCPRIDCYFSDFGCLIPEQGFKCYQNRFSKNWVKFLQATFGKEYRDFLKEHESKIKGNQNAPLNA